MKPIKAFVACVASISARVRRESWDESKKKECRRIGVHAAENASKRPETRANNKEYNKAIRYVDFI